MKFSRSDKSLLAQWWFTVDRLQLTAVTALAGFGVLLSLAAGPTIALKRGLPAFHFVERHLLFASLGLALAFTISLMRPPTVRRLSLLLLLGSFAAMGLVLFIGPDVNGAQRWLRYGGFQLQPSEFMKPAFVVVAAWLFAEEGRGIGVPALPIAIGLWLITVVLLILEPDFGQTLLISGVWGMLFFISGKPMKIVAGLAALGIAGIAAAYQLIPHVRARLDNFLIPSTGPNSQVDRARQSFIEGGWLGRGPGEGTVKSSFPDAHTDFIFSVVAEEYGVIACLILLALFAFVVLRAFQRSFDEPDPFARFAAMGLATQIGAQALINMGVNVGLLPAKGMTLPFISYGGSSLLGISIAAGFLLALTRRRPQANRPKNSIFLPSESRTGLG